MKKVRYEVVEDNSIFKGIYIHRKSLDGVNSKYIWEIRIRVMIFVGRKNASMFSGFSIIKMHYLQILKNKQYILLH